MLAQVKARADQAAQTSAAKINLSNPSKWRSIARSNQIAPDSDWLVWLLLAGRGFGKTRTINEWANEQAYRQVGSRGAIVAATAADARDVVVEGESGLRAVNPLIQYEPSKRRLTWPNGSIATLFSADEPERLRGPQYHWAVCDELAAWRYPEAFDLLMLGLRLGDHPRCAIATTPKPTKIIREIMTADTTHITRGSTYENKPNLSESFFRQIVSKYEGTRLGRQEIYAEVIEDYEGALWRHDQIEAQRVYQLPTLSKIVVAVDPSTTSKETSDEAGIVVAGSDSSGHGYILEDLSLRGSPHQWASAAVAAYNKYRANVIVAESNQGGDMVALTIQTVDPSAYVKLIHAKQGKRARAEPVAGLCGDPERQETWVNGRVHHVGMLASLEDELCSWDAKSNESPNRLDAMVYAILELELSGQESYSEANYAQPYNFSDSEY